MFLTGGHGNTADHPNFLLRTGNGSEQIAEFHICIPILTALGELQGPYTCCIALQLLPSFGFRLSFSVFRDRQMLRSTPQCKIGKKPDGIESMAWMLQAISPLLLSLACRLASSPEPDERFGFLSRRRQIALLW
jgi:hypothetical protein